MRLVKKILETNEKKIEKSKSNRLEKSYRFLICFRDQHFIRGFQKNIIFLLIAQIFTH